MPAPISDAHLFDIMWTTRAMRKYKPDPVPEELLVQLVDAALHGPSGSNAQNWAFIVVTDPAQKARLQKVYSKAWYFYRDTIAKAQLRPHEDPETRERIEKACDHLADHLAEVPALIFVGVREDHAFDQALLNWRSKLKMVKHLGPAGTAKFAAAGTKSTAMAKGSTAYPAVQNLLLAARALGLGATMTTQHFFVPGEFEELLGMPEDVTLAAIVPVGWPTGKFGPTRRPDPKEVMHWNRWQGTT